MPRLRALSKFLDSLTPEEEVQYEAWCAEERAYVIGAVHDRGDPFPCEEEGTRLTDGFVMLHGEGELYSPTIGRELGLDPRDYS